MLLAAYVFQLDRQLNIRGASAENSMYDVKLTCLQCRIGFALTKEISPGDFTRIRILGEVQIDNS